MFYSFFSTIRDIVLLCMLFFLIKIAFDRTCSFIQLHKESIIHELDRSFIDQIYTAQRQLHFLEEHPVHGDIFAHAIATIKEQLSSIEEKYKKNSPGLALLGPLGSAAIVKKEEELQLKLLSTINDLNKIFTHINNQPTNYANLLTNNPIDKPEKCIPLIDNILSYNKQLLLTLT